MSRLMSLKRCRRVGVPYIYSSATVSPVSSIAHVLMSCWQVWCAQYHEIKIPVQYVRTTFQVHSKCGCPPSVGPERGGWWCGEGQVPQQKGAIWGLWDATYNLMMNNFFLPTSREVLPTFFNILPIWGLFCPDSSSFCPLSKSGQEKGCFG